MLPAVQHHYRKPGGINRTENWVWLVKKRSGVSEPGEAVQQAQGQRSIHWSFEFEATQNVALHHCIEKFCNLWGIQMQHKITWSAGTHDHDCVEDPQQANQFRLHMAGQMQSFLHHQQSSSPHFVDKTRSFHAIAHQNTARNEQEKESKSPKH